MASGTGNLPNQSMSFSPFAILTAEEMNDLVENIESLADGTGIGDSVVTPEKRSGGHAVGSFTAPGSSGSNFSVDTLDFKPGSIEFTCVAASGSNSRSSLGYTDGTNQVAVASVNAAATVVATNACILAINTDGGNAVRASISSLNADGFTVNFSAANSAYTVIWRAIR